MSAEPAHLEWQSIDPTRIMPDVLSQFKSYHELDDDTSPLVTPQPLQGQSREDPAAPYFSSSVSDESEDFSSSPFLSIDSNQSNASGLNTPSFLSVLNNQPCPDIAASPFFTAEGSQSGANGSHLGLSPESENAPSHPAGFLSTEEASHSNPSGASLTLLTSGRCLPGGVPSQNILGAAARSEDSAVSDISVNGGNYFLDYLNSSGFERLSASVAVETHASPVELSQPAARSPQEENEPEKSPTEFVILGEKYILMGALDPSTVFAVHKDTREYYHVKSVPVRTAHEVVCQHALLQDFSRVRGPVEVFTSKDGRKSWMVFPPHYGDLHSYVRRRRRLRETEAQRLLNQIVSILDKCHEAGLVLGDLKLRKFVFSDSSRQEIILDSLEDSVYTGTNDILHEKHGCPAYVAPEILTISTFSGRLADMWGLGVILYTMLVGRYPFHNPDTATLFAKIRNGKYSIPEWVSTRARHLILSLLRRQPNRRLSTKQVLCHPWLIRPPREHWTRDTTDHNVPGEVSKTLLMSNKM